MRTEQEEEEARAPAVSISIQPSDVIKMVKTLILPLESNHYHTTPIQREILKLRHVEYLQSNTPSLDSVKTSNNSTDTSRTNLTNNNNTMNNTPSFSLNTDLLGRVSLRYISIVY